MPERIVRRYKSRWCCVGGWALLLGVACDPGPPPPELDLPERPSDAPGGAEVVRALRALDLEAREERVYAEIARGNVPTWLRQFGRVELEGVVNGRQHEVTFWATLDYLAVGSDDDFVFVPQSPQLAQRIADLVGSSLPTPLMVDAIWSSARARLAPIRIEPDEFMTTVRYFERHDRLVQAQRNLQGVAQGAFAAGHKKDVVLTPSLAENPGRVALYGWHRLDGQPLQPLSTVLRDSWVGFNHGVRLVHRQILVDGSRRDLSEVLSDPELASLLSRDGVIAEPRYSVLRTEQ